MFKNTDLVFEMGKLQKFAWRLTRNKADADDLLQSTCLRAMEKADYFDDDSNLFSWTSKIMFNLFATGFRRRTRFESAHDPDIYLDKESIEPTQDTDVELSNVKRAILKLSADHQEVIFLICIKGLLYKEASKILSIPSGTVRSRLSRARLQLKEIMAAPLTTPPAISMKIANNNHPIIPAFIASKALQSRHA